MARKNQANYPLNEVLAFSDFKSILDINAEKYADKPAIMYKLSGEVKEMSYKTFRDETDALGTALTLLGMGDKNIAMVSENNYRCIVTYLAVLKSEGVYVPVDKELPHNEIAYIIDNSDSKVLFFSKHYEEKIREIEEKLPQIEYFVGLDLEEDDGKYLSYEKLLQKGRDALAEGNTDFINMKPQDNDMKLLVYTSGTTGTAKGVMLSLHNLTSLVYHGQRVANFYDPALSVLPYHHTYEAVCGILVGLHSGTTICVNDNLRQVSNNLKLFKPRMVMLVPLFLEAMYKKVWANVDEKGLTETFKKLMKVSNALLKVGIDMRKVFFKSVHEGFGGNLQKIVVGGAPLRKELAEFFETIGITVTNGYGITECSPLVSVNRDFYNNSDSVGTKLPCVDIKIFEPNEDGEGEICVKGDTVMLGYYKMPEKTAEVMEEDGWFHTGDYGKIGDDDRLYITGRKKNLIVLKNGKNIYPEEIEEYISNLSVVNEVIVTAVKNDDGEEIGLAAEIYPEQTEIEGLDEEAAYSKIKEAVEKLNDTLPPHKNVHKVTIRTEPFEKTTSGKIRRKYN